MLSSPFYAIMVPDGEGKHHKPERGKKMAKSKATLENELRVKALAVISAALEKEFDSEILPTSSSEIAIPVVDSEENECFIKVKVSIPRGTCMRRRGS